MDIKEVIDGCEEGDKVIWNEAEGIISRIPKKERIMTCQNCGNNYKANEVNPIDQRFCIRCPITRLEGDFTS